MGKKIISINEGKLSEFKLHSIWLRERLNGSEFVDQNNLQRLYEPSLLDENLFINSHNVNENILNVEFSDGAKGSFNIDDLYNEINNIDVIPEKKYGMSVNKIWKFLIIIKSLRIKRNLSICLKYFINMVM